MGSVGLWVCLLEALAADPVHDRARAEVKNVTCATTPLYSLLMDLRYGDATRICNSVKQSLVSGNRERPKRKRGGELSGIPSREPYCQKERIVHTQPKAHRHAAPT